MKPKVVLHILNEGRKVELVEHNLVNDIRALEYVKRRIGSENPEHLYTLGVFDACRVYSTLAHMIKTMNSKGDLHVEY